MILALYLLCLSVLILLIGANMELGEPEEQDLTDIERD